MDDGVLVEPLIGARPWANAQCLEDSIHLCWGPNAINEEKKAEEGTWAAEQLVWGLYMDFEAPPLGQIRLPEPKRVKGQYLLALPELQPGRREVPLRTAREVVGAAGHWCCAQPALLPEMGGPLQDAGNR